MDASPPVAGWTRTRRCARARAESLGVPVVVEALDDAVDPAEAEGFFHGLFVGHAGPPGLLLVEDEPELHRGVVLRLQSGAPTPAGGHRDVGLRVPVQGSHSYSMRPACLGSRKSRSRSPPVPRHGAALFMSRPAATSHARHCTTAERPVPAAAGLNPARRRGGRRARFADDREV